jgi:ankyrin repeat protein
MTTAVTDRAARSRKELLLLVGLPVLLVVLLLGLGLAARDRPPRQQDLDRALLRAVQHREYELAATALARGASPDARSPALLGATPLMLAAVMNDAALVKTLLEAGADPNLRSSIGKTAVIEAVSNIAGDKTAILETLLEAGADPELADGDGWTPAIWATYQDRPEALRTLLKHGADPNASDRHGETVLQYAVSGGHVECVRVLLDGGADPGARGSWNEPVLTRARREGRAEIAELLLKAGAGE